MPQTHTPNEGAKELRAELELAVAAVKRPGVCPTQLGVGAFVAAIRALTTDVDLELADANATRTAIYTLKNGDEQATNALRSAAYAIRARTYAACADSSTGEAGRGAIAAIYRQLAMGNARLAVATANEAIAIATNETTDGNQP